MSVEKCCFCGRKCVFSLRGHCSPLSTRKECRCVSPLFSGTYDTKMTKSKTDSKIWGTMCLSVEAYIVSVDRFVASARGLGCWLLLGHSGAGSSSAARSSKTPWDNRFWSIAARSAPARRPAFSTRTPQNRDNSRENRTFSRLSPESRSSPRETAILAFSGLARAPVRRFKTPIVLGGVLSRLVLKWGLKSQAVALSPLRARGVQGVRAAPALSRLGRGHRRQC